MHQDGATFTFIHSADLTVIPDFPTEGHTSATGQPAIFTKANTLNTG